MHGYDMIVVAPLFASRVPTFLGVGQMLIVLLFLCKSYVHDFVYVGTHTRMELLMCKYHEFVNEIYV